MNTILDEIKLDRLSALCEGFTVPTRHGDTYVVAAGSNDAPPIVLIPAMGVTSKMWLPNLAPLGREYRAYALDTIGDRGGSTLRNPKQYPKNGRSYSEWLVDVFDELGIEQADIIGASMGGWIAMNHAIHAPERVRRIVLLGPMGLPSWWMTLKVVFHLWSVFLFPTRSNIDRIIRWALGDDPRVYGAFADFMRMGAKSWNSLRIAPPLNLSDDQLRKIRAPALLMLGERDNVIGDARAVGDRARRLVSNIQVEIISDVGHMMSTEKPEFVNACILSFLQEEITRP